MSLVTDFDSGAQRACRSEQKGRCAAYSRDATHNLKVFT